MSNTVVDELMGHILHNLDVRIQWAPLPHLFLMFTSIVWMTFWERLNLVNYQGILLTYYWFNKQISECQTLYFILLYLGKLYCKKIQSMKICICPRVHIRGGDLDLGLGLKRSWKHSLRILAGINLKWLKIWKHHWRLGVEVGNGR